MGDSDYCTALAHVVLAGSSVWALKSLRPTPYDDYKWAYGTFAIHLLNAFLGVFRFGNPEYGSKIKTVYNDVSYVTLVFSFPCVATQLYLNYRYKTQLVLLHVAFTLIPLLNYASRKRGKIKWLLDLCMTANIVSVLYLSVVHDNYYGIAMCVCYSVNHFAIGNSGRIVNLPALDLFTYATCFFNYFAIKALKD